MRSHLTVKSCHSILGVFKSCPGSAGCSKVEIKANLLLWLRRTLVTSALILSEGIRDAPAPWSADGARLRSLPRCCSDADFHQLLTCSKIVLQSSWDVDQTRCAFGKPTGQISCLFQVACPALAVLRKKKPGRKQPADISQGCSSWV